MGRQEGLVQFSGTIGNISFYKTADGFLARQKGGVNGNRIKTDPAYARTRENLAEFSRSGRAAKVLRAAFSDLIPAKSDIRMTSRLVAKMAEALRKDAVNPHGERNVSQGDPSVLLGFEFNLKATLTTTFKPQIATSIDRASGAMVVDIPAFTTSKLVSIPDGATHYLLKAGGAAIDFRENTYMVAASQSENLPVSAAVQEPMQLSIAGPAGSVHPLYLAFGIEFLQIINNVQKPLNNGAHNALAIVNVDVVPAA